MDKSCIIRFYDALSFERSLYIYELVHRLLFIGAFLARHSHSLLKSLIKFNNRSKTFLMFRASMNILTFFFGAFVHSLGQFFPSRGNFSEGLQIIYAPKIYIWSNLISAIF